MLSEPILSYSSSLVVCSFYLYEVDRHHDYHDVMRRSSLVGFVSRFLPSMPVRVRVSPHPGASRSSARGFAPASSSPSSSEEGTHSKRHPPTTVYQADPPVLLLEGDSFEVSHDGIARTFYQLMDQGLPSVPQKSTPLLGIEEFYDLKEAHKTFVLREEARLDENGEDDNTKEILLGKQAQGLVPMGKALARMSVQEIDEGVFGAAGTGATTWESSLVMGLYFADHYKLLRGDLLEIGSGVGVGAVLSHMAPLACQHDLKALESVTLTDGNDRCIQQCRQNIRDAWKNLAALSPNMENPPRVHVTKLDWTDPVHKSMVEQYDTIIACDVCYLYPDIEPLARTIQSLLKKDGCLHLFGPYNRSAFQHLCRRLHEDMEVSIESLQLERFRLRPADNFSPTSHYGSLRDIALPRERIYASKSQATILHVTARHREDIEKTTKHPVDMEGLD